MELGKLYMSYTLNFVRSGVNISKIAIFLEKLREGDLWDKFFWDLDKGIFVILHT